MIQIARIALGAAALLFAGCAQVTPAPAQAGVSHAAPPDAPSAETALVRAERIPVAFGDVRELAALVERTLVGSRSQGPVRAVLVDETTGELVVFATPEGLARVKAFLSPAVVESNGEDEVEVLSLAHADAQNLVHVVSPMIHGRVRIMADAPTNALVVRGDAEARARVKKTVAELDVAKQ